MIKIENKKLGCSQYILYPGDYYATNEECIIGSVAGACLLVAMYDYTRRIGGMGHFIVPGTIGTEGILKDDIANHGIANLEYILGEIVKLGGDRKFLKAKIFGAGYSGDSNEMREVVKSNMKFIREYFKMENIAVEKEDIGGDFRRKILFFPMKGIVYRKVLQNNEDASEYIKLEKEYIDNAFRNKEKFGKVIMFD